MSNLVGNTGKMPHFADVSSIFVGRTNMDINTKNKLFSSLDLRGDGLVVWSVLFLPVFLPVRRFSPSSVFLL